MANKKQKARPKARAKTRKRGGGGRSAPREWVGGRLLAPLYITEPDRPPYRPELILWFELPEGFVVGQAIIDPQEPPISFGQTLRDAMRAPTLGPPRQPQRVRVADAQLAAEVRRALPEIAEVVVAPTPELDELLQRFAEFESGNDAPPSYLEGGRLSPAAIARLFRAAEALYRLAPWTFLGEDLPLRLDIPQLEIDGACITIIGGLDEERGFVVFPSLLARELFLEGVEAHQERGGALDLGTAMLVLDFERGAELPDPMRKEIAAHGWPVAGAEAYPTVTYRDPDGLPRPLEATDVAVVTACATALTAFCQRLLDDDLDDDDLDDDDLDPICASVIDDEAGEVRLTAPYQAAPSGDLPAADDRRPALPEGDHDNVTAASSLHAIDRRLVDDMIRFAARRFGDAFWAAADDFDDFEASAQLSGAWAVHHFLVEGRPIAVWYHEAKQRQLSAPELAWLAAQRFAWLSVWEVEAVDAGRSINLRDMLTDERRTVREVSGSQVLGPRDALLARVVDHAGIAVLCGSHPRPLPPLAAAEVVRRVRGRLRRKRAVPVARLRDEKLGRYLIARWDEAVDELDLRASRPPRLQNTDGDELLSTIDHFQLAPGRRAEVEAQLAGLEDVEPPDPDDSERAYVFSRTGRTAVAGLDVTLIGRAIVSEGKLRLETNSVRRADALRARLEATCGEALHHRLREHTDPVALMGGAGVATATPTTAAAATASRRSSAANLPPDVAARLILEMKTRHYAAWPDEPLPALGGKTARQAVATPAGREQVDLLLADCEHREAHEPPERRYDFAALRAELGLTD